MVASLPDRPARRARGLCLSAALCCSLVLTAGVAAAASRPAGEAVTLDAASSEVDYRSNTVIFRDVIITQGDVRVSAQRARATGLNFDDSTWTFSGDVRITVQGGALRSSEATVNFTANRVAKAVIRGKPAEFEQKLDQSAGMARGRAESLEYDLVKRTVRLSDDAWLSDGSNEIRGQQLVYDLREQRVEAGSRAGRQDRVQITIRPGATPPSPAPAPAPPGATPAPAPAPTPTPAPAPQP